MVKAKTAADEVPVLMTLADVPGAPVVVVPTVTVAAVPGAPVAPVAPGVPVAPTSPRGMVKLKTAADVVPVLVTLADVPGAPVVVVPTVIVAAAPGGPAAPADAIVWFGHVPVMVTLLPATRDGVAVPVPPLATDTGVVSDTVTAPVPPPVNPVPAVTLDTPPAPPVAAIV